MFMCNTIFFFCQTFLPFSLRLFILLYFIFILLWLILFFLLYYKFLFISSIHPPIQLHSLFSCLCMYMHIIVLQPFSPSFPPPLISPPPHFLLPQFPSLSYLLPFTPVLLFSPAHCLPLIYCSPPHLLFPLPSFSAHSHCLPLIYCSPSSVVPSPLIFCPFSMYAPPLSFAFPLEIHRRYTGRRDIWDIQWSFPWSQTWW